MGALAGPIMGPMTGQGLNGRAHDRPLLVVPVN